MFTWYPSRLTSHIAAALTIAVAVAIVFVQPIIGLGDEPLPTGHYKFTEVKVVPIDRSKIDGKTIDSESDKLTHWVRFDVRAQFEKIKGTENFPFTLLNPTDSTNSHLTLDKPITFQGEPVPAGTNLLNYKKFDGKRFNVTMPDLSPLVTNSVRISSGFEIPPDTYAVTFEWTTSDGQVISDKVTVLIDVDLNE